MDNPDDNVLALFDGSATFAWLERGRQRGIAALDRSACAQSWYSLTAAWRLLRRPERRRQSGIVVLVAVITHAALLSTSSGFHEWVVYILPAIAAAVATMAILTGAAPGAGTRPR